MEILHGIQGAVEIVHGTVELIAGAIGLGEVKGPLEEPGLGFESSQAPVNRLGQGLGVNPLQETPQPLGKVSFTSGLVQMPEFVEQRLPEGRFGTAPIPDFNHLMEEAQNPDNAGT